MTDLPELPEGYFFRILPFNLDTSVYTVQVELHKRDGKRSKVLGRSLATSDVAEIQQAARRAYDDSCKVIARNLTLTDRDKFLGDYPPKRLGDFEGRL